MKLTPGSRWRSAVCETEVIVVRLAVDDVDLRCGGQPMAPLGEEPPDGLALEPALAEGTALGKRYTDGTGDLELLCTKPGAGSLSIGNELLVLKEAKPLPSSD
jgi:hypothetical protein